MQLLQIKKSTSTDKVWLTFDDGSFIPFNMDDLVIHKIKIGIIDNYQLLCELSLKFLLNNYALRQIAISPKVRQILAPKLVNQAKYYQTKYHLNVSYAQIIENILSYLDEKGWLDSIAYAKFLLKKHSKKSKRYLEQLFAFYHLDKTLLISNDQDNIKKLLLKKISHLSNPLDFKTKNKLIQSLVQKGFAYSDIKFVIDEIAN
ncbi:MAG: RecX family transcriptional regulator [Candidatus Shapirobacteria bacterium]